MRLALVTLHACRSAARSAANFISSRSATHVRSCSQGSGSCSTAADLPPLARELAGGCLIDQADRAGRADVSARAGPPRSAALRCRGFQPDVLGDLPQGRATLVALLVSAHRRRRARLGDPGPGRHRMMLQAEVGAIESREPPSRRPAAEGSRRVWALVIPISVLASDPFNQPSGMPAARMRARASGSSRAMRSSASRFESLMMPSVSRSLTESPTSVPYLRFVYGSP
jgi:hypothetical protein